LFTKPTARDISASFLHTKEITMLTSSFTGVRVASKTTQKAQKINTTVEARRTKASAPAKKSAFKVRTHSRREWSDSTLALDSIVS
jgi:hypothetical protein